MNTGEKVLQILMAKDDKEMYAAIDKLTDNQKAVVIVSLIKKLKLYQPGDLSIGDLGLDGV